MGVRNSIWPLIACPGGGARASLALLNVLNNNRSSMAATEIKPKVPYDTSLTITIAPPFDGGAVQVMACGRPSSTSPVVGVGV